MVIDHIAKPDYLQNGFAAWSEDMARLAKYKNVHCKLSGMINEVPFWSTETFKPYVDHCLGKISGKVCFIIDLRDLMLSEVFGGSRVMYGSDWPVCKLSQPQADYQRTLDLLVTLTGHLSPEVRHNIFYQNVLDFYGLQDVL